MSDFFTGEGIALKNELIKIGTRIVESKEQLVKHIFERECPFYKEKLKKSTVARDQIAEWRKALIQILGESLYTDREESGRRIEKWARETGETAIENGVPLDESLRVLSLFRSVIWDVFTEELEKNQFAAVTMLDVSKIINPLLDEVAYIFSNIYMNHSTRKIEVAQTALQELSVPVVPISADIAVLPLVGEVDTERAKFIMEKCLKNSTELQLKQLFIDVSGVPMIDTMVAHNLFQIVKSLNLIGVKATMTGIRPEIAQTIVALGIEFREIPTRANLKQALMSAGFEQTKR
ncbi:modulator protein [Bacillus sp. UMB0728]|nr:modulator protein [Bacillus sp. UMB0728]